MVGISIELVDTIGKVHLANVNNMPLCGTAVHMRGHIALSAPTPFTQHLADPVCTSCRNKAHQLGVQDEHAPAHMIPSKRAGGLTPYAASSVVVTQGGQEVPSTVNMATGVVTIEADDEAQAPVDEVKVPVVVVGEYGPEQDIELPAIEYLRQGYDANRASKLRTDCPYPYPSTTNLFSMRRHNWLQGWDMGDDEQERP